MSENNFFRQKYYLIFLFFVSLLPRFIDERSHNALSLFDEGAIEQF